MASLTSSIPAFVPLRPVVLPLTARPDLAPLVARWIWEGFWQEQGAMKAEADAFVSSAATATGMPQAFVLLLGGTPAGTASLVADDLGARPDLTPWLASVWVEPWARGQGHAGALVRAVEDAAREAGVGTLWLYTRRAERTYQRAGWVTLERFTHLGSPAALMRRTIHSGGISQEPG